MIGRGNSRKIATSEWNAPNTPIRNNANESTTNQGEFHMRGRRSYDVASFFSHVDRVELEFLALEKIIGQMTCYIEMISKEVDHSPKVRGSLPNA